MDALRDLVFLPIDVPRFPYKDRVAKDFLHTDFEYAWNEEFLTTPLRIHGERADWKTEARAKYGYLIDWIEGNLPFEWYSEVILMNLVDHGPPHVDIADPADVNNPEPWDPGYVSHLLENEPSGYRVLIGGDRDALYFTKQTYDGTNREQARVYARISDETDVYALAPVTQPHGIDRPASSADRLILYIDGKVDAGRHRALLEKSYRRFKDFAVYRFK